MAKKLDMQVDEVYEWERQWFGWKNGGLMSGLKGTKNWVNWACWRYGVEPPKVKFFKSNRWAGMYKSKKDTIVVARGSNNRLTALHEAAHVVAYKMFGDLSHGKKWLGIYVDLLVAANVAPREALEASLVHRGLKFKKNFNPKKAKKARKR